MKKRLKTLKDLGKCPDCKMEDKEYRCVEMYYLREEAIKWVESGLSWLEKQPSVFRIKEILNRNIIFTGLNPIGHESEERMKGRIMGFIFFFNITGEDLK